MTDVLLQQSKREFTRSLSAASMPSAQSSAQDERICKIPLSALQRSPYQPRLGTLTKNDVADLMRSLSAVGQTSPILVQPASQDAATFYVHQGERRWTAARLLGWDTINAVVRPDLDEATARRIALADNLHRADLSAWDQANALNGYCNATGTTVEDAAAQLGIGRTTAFRLKALLQVSDGLLEVLRDAAISPRVGDVLARIDAKDPRRALKLAHRYLAGQVAVSSLEDQLDKIRGEAVRTPARKEVTLRSNARSVELRIHYSRADVANERKHRVLKTIGDFLAMLGITSDEALAVWQQPRNEG